MLKFLYGRQATTVRPELRCKTGSLLGLAEPISDLTEASSAIRSLKLGKTRELECHDHAYERQRKS